MTAGVMRAGRKDKKKRRKKRGRKKNQCEAEAGISCVMVTKCSAALTDGGAALYPPLYLRGPGSDITEIYDVYVTVINEKRSEKNVRWFLSLSVYQSANSGKNHATCPAVCFVLFGVVFFLLVKSQFMTSPGGRAPNCNRIPTSAYSLMASAAVQPR